MRKLIDAKDYGQAIDLSNKYRDANDPELTDLKVMARKLRLEERNAARTKEILAELKTIPASRVKRNAALYKSLVDMHPENKAYKMKLLFYQQKVKEQEAARIAQAKRREKIKKQFSAWDGAHINLERFIKDNMHDPGSYDHVKTVWWDKGDHILVQTTFRGTNAFGALRLNTINAKVSDGGTILQILK